jgi:hypothetical protein
MLKKLVTITAMAAITFAFAQCSAGYAPPAGSLYTDVSFNKDVSTKTGVGGKNGEACATGILGVISTGDASVKAAASKGGVGTINSVDYSRKDILGSVYSTVCTVVHGD